MSDQFFSTNKTPPSKNAVGRVYTENSGIPNDIEFPLVAAIGSQNNKPFNNTNTLQDLITRNARDNANYDPNLQDIDPNSKNGFLDIPSFLSYPQDLGKNRRHHHFMVFNIYQGSSDTVRLVQREIKQMESALLAKGQTSLGSQDASRDSADNSRRVLTEAGFAPDQIEKFVKAFVGATGDLAVFGITADERINEFEKLFLGKIQALAADKKTDGGDGTVGITDVATTFMSVAWTESKDVVSEMWSYFARYFEAALRDNLDPRNQPRRNDSQVGVSGRRVNRAKSERNILLANRRFNFANVKSKDTICLYMPLKIAFNDQLVYSEEEMGMTKQLMDTLVLKRGGVSGLVEKAGTNKIADALTITNQVGIDNLNVQGLRNATTRSVSNPRREMAFKDVGMRTHTFSFDFAPKNEEEAQTVLDIIRMLRYHAYPGLQGGGGHFFTFPAEFEATFYTVAENGAILVNDNLPKIPKLALQAVSVDYSSAGDYKTFSDSKPAFIRLELQFTEMEQLTNEHIIHGY
jgi:hypothetical protein